MMPPSSASACSSLHPAFPGSSASTNPGLKKESLSSNLQVQRYVEMPWQWDPTMSKKAPAKVGGRCRSDERRLFRGLPVWLILTFALGILTHKVVFNRGEPQREVGQEIEAPESLSRGGGSMIGEYESIEAVLMCAMIGTGVESQMMVDLVRALHRKVRVGVLVNSVEQVSECRRLLSQAGIPAGGVDLLRCNANSPWLRDYGPLFVRKADGKIAAVESAYLRSADSNNLNLVLANDEFAIALSNGLDLEVDSLPILLDGGNFISNGGRLVCTTTRVLAKLKTEKLVLDWRKRRTTRAAVRVEIEKMLDDGLPEKFTSELFEQKCGALFQHMLEKYPQRDASIYETEVA